VDIDLNASNFPSGLKAGEPGMVWSGLPIEESSTPLETVRHRSLKSDIGPHGSAITLPVGSKDGALNIEPMTPGG
jgi:hypothetical protein